MAKKKLVVSSKKVENVRPAAVAVAPAPAKPPPAKPKPVSYERYRRIASQLHQHRLSLKWMVETQVYGDDIGLPLGIEFKRPLDANDAQKQIAETIFSGASYALKALNDTMDQLLVSWLDAYGDLQEEDRHFAVEVLLPTKTNEIEKSEPG